MDFKVRLLDLEAGGKYIVVMGIADARRLGVVSNDRLMLRSKGLEVAAILNTADEYQDGLLGVYREVGTHLNLVESVSINVVPAERPESLNFIRNKIMGEKLLSNQIELIVEDVVQRHLSEIELASFVTALEIHGTSMEEVEALSKAMVKRGKTINFPQPPILDKHSIGGVPGDKTTLIVVPIIAAEGYRIPKSSSRAITSPAGTADRMETLCPVDLRIKDILRVVNEVNACIVWGGSLDLAPADDLFIQVEYPLSIDPLLLPSIMSKKKAMGSTHVVIDIPTGREAKIKSIQEGQQLAFNFIELGNRLGMNIRCAITEGEQPIGYAIGPALEAKEALKTLKGNGPTDLVDKATSIAGILLEMMGEKSGKRKALDILMSGRAEEQMRQIIEAQGGNSDIAPEELEIGRFHADLISERAGKVLYINNQSLAQIARVTGAPNSKESGIVLEAKLGEEIEVGEPLFHIYSNNARKLQQAQQLSKELEPVFVGRRMGERMVMMKISESTKPGAERYIIDR